MGCLPPLCEEQLSLNSFNLGLSSSCSIPLTSVLGRDTAPASLNPCIHPPSHAYTVCAVFPCLKLPSAAACPALQGHSPWQTGGVCSHCCSHTAPFTLAVTVASERLRHTGELMGSVGKVLPPPTEGTGIREQGQPVQAVGQQGQNLWGADEAQKPHQKVAILTLWPMRPCSPGIPNWPGSP